MQWGDRSRRTLPYVAAATVTVLGAVHGWRTSHWVEGEIPTYDVADYMLRAEHFRSSLATGDPSAFAAQLFESNVHPPGLPAAMAVWALVAGPGFAGASVFSAFVSTVNLVLIVLFARQCAPGWGLLPGAAAAGVVAASPLHASLFAVPMTEPLALFAVLSTLSLVAGPQGLVRDLAISSCILLGAVTRYNLAPMLLFPVAAVSVLEAIEARKLTPLRTPVLAVTVLGGYFGLWYSQNAAMTEGLGRFFRNVDSGIPLFSAANLHWLWKALYGDVAASVTVAVAAVVGLTTAALLPTRARARVAVVFTAVAIAALLLHRYKLGRNLYVVAPVWFVAACLGLQAGVVERARPYVGWALLGLAIAHGVRVRDQQAETPRYYTEDRHLRHGLEAITGAAQLHDQVVIVGAHRELNKHLLELWLSAYAPGTSILFEEQYPPACVRREVQPRQVSRCQLDEVLGSLRQTQPPRGTAYVAIAAWSPRASRADWTTRMAADLASVLGGTDRFSAETTTLRSLGMQVTIYAERASIE